eukprot:TRINITY_DN8124_c0_g1_i1.p1 TRINITY_DN8124_c0_g1~~TRINITY_DN8124_c0_g1_i1.p1  ORF type:complete len:871 (-),score=222.33 TRINITY_DN8124_c0_g1_i1:554-3166(-)
MDLNKLYKLEKQQDPGKVSDRVKWETLLKSKHSNILQSAMFWSQQLFLKNEAFEVFKELIYLEDDEVVSNAIYCLINFVQSEPVVQAIKERGFRRFVVLFQRMEDTDKKAYLLQFLCNVLHIVPELQEQFISDDGVVFVVHVLTSSPEEEITNAALQIFTNILSTRQKTQNYNIFANEDIFKAFCLLLLSDSYHPQIIEVIYSIMAALVQTSANRTLFLKSRCISTFVEILKKQTDVHQNAMKVLSNVLTDIDCAWEAVSNGAFITIIQCLESKNFDTVSASLTALSNLAFHEDLIDLAFEDFPSNQTLDPIIKHLSSTNTAVRDRAVRAVSNLLAHQSSQPWFQKTEKCLKRLIEIAKTDEKGETHETRERAVTAIFHMTMHTDEMRNFVILNGLDQLLFLLTSPKQPLDLKKEIAKAMINLSLSDETFMETKAVAALLEVIAHGLVGSDSKLHSQDRKRENEIEELIAISLENLATSRAATAKIERCGGVLASIAFLSRVHHIPSLQEHSALLIARFAINSRMRAHYQARGIEQLLADMDTKADPAAQATIRLAIHHVSMKHYEDDLIPEPENAFPEFDDLDLDTESEEEEDEEFSEEDVKKIAITTASLVSDSPAMRSVDEEEIVDHSISKEFYAIEDEDPSPQVSPLKKGQSLSTKKDKTKSVMTFLSKRRRSSAAATEEFSINLPKVSQRKLHRHLSPKKIISTQSYDPERLKLAKMHYKRTKVAQELLSSEATYVRNLSIMIKKYLNPLSQMARSKKPLIKENQLKLIFSTVEALFGYHSMLLEILNQRMARWSTKQKLGDVYLDIGESFKAYTEYINNFNTSQQTLEKCVNSSAKVAKWLEHTRNLQRTKSDHTFDHSGSEAA